MSDDAVTWCRGCTDLGRCRTGITAETLLPDGSTTTTAVCGPEFEGGPEVAHGRWIAGFFDEILGRLPRMHGSPGVTAHLEVDYLRPVPIGRPLVGRARVDRQEGRRWYVAAELVLASTGAVLARGNAVMVVRAADHFDRHQAWLAEQEPAAGAASSSSDRREGGPR